MRVGSSVNFTSITHTHTHTHIIHYPVTRINTLCGHQVPLCTCTASPQAIPSGRVGPIAPGQDPDFYKEHADTHRGMWWPHKIIFSPGETPINRAPARLYSRTGKHPPTAHLRGYILARGNTQLHTCAVIFSHGETPTNCALAQLYSRPGKHPPTAHRRGVIRAHTQLHSVAAAGFPEPPK